MNFGPTVCSLCLTFLVRDAQDRQYCPNCLDAEEYTVRMSSLSPEQMLRMDEVNGTTFYDAYQSLLELTNEQRASIVAASQEKIEDLAT